jgi:hypothetical protein
VEYCPEGSDRAGQVKGEQACDAPDDVEYCPEGSGRAGEAEGDEPCDNPGQDCLSQETARADLVQSQDPCAVTPNLPSQTDPTCSVAGEITEPAEQTGVEVGRTELGDGKVEFVSTPAAGYSFTGEAQSVVTTVQAKPRLTGSACGEVLGDHGTAGKPSVKPAAAEVKGVGAVRRDAQVLGESATLPTSVDAGLAGQPQGGSRPAPALIGQALLGGGLLLLVVTGWSGLGRRRHGVPQV